MKIVLMGPKGAGKSSVGAALSECLGLAALETDHRIEEVHAAETGDKLTCREIYNTCGESYFRGLEENVCRKLAETDWCIIVTGGSTMLSPASRRALRKDAILVYLTGSPDILWKRAIRRGVPSWLQGEDGFARFTEQLEHRDEVLIPFADIVQDTSDLGPNEIADSLSDSIANEVNLRMASGSTFGSLVRVTTFGESHGPAIGAVFEGVAPGTPISVEGIQRELDRRRPGQSKLVTRRSEADQVHILSGVFEDKATGAPIAMVIYNEDQKSYHYDDLRELFRPGHADFTFYRKYGLRDHRGGGRSSGRETACRVAAGAIACQILQSRGVRLVAHAVEVAGIAATQCDYSVIEQNPVRCADAEAAVRMEEAILEARKEADSVGGIVQLDVFGLPPGLGDPVFGKLDARLAAAVMSIGAVKGVEFGGGFELARLKGSQSNDPLHDGGFISNSAGGILGGMSSGQPLILRAVVKPTSSIGKPQQTMDIHGENREIIVHGRHDPCIVSRAVPVIEAMAALVILDVWEIQERIRPDWNT